MVHECLPEIVNDEHDRRRPLLSLSVKQWPSGPSIRKPKKCVFVGVNLLPNVTLADEDTRMMDGLGQADVEHLSLQTSVQEVLDLEAEHVIELHLALIEHADADQASEERIALEQTSRVLLVEGEQLSGGLADLGQRVAYAPHFVLVAQTELADELQLLVEALLLEGTTRS